MHPFWSRGIPTARCAAKLMRHLSYPRSFAIPLQCNNTFSDTRRDETKGFKSRENSTLRSIFGEKGGGEEKARRSSIASFPLPNAIFIETLRNARVISFVLRKRFSVLPLLHVRFAISIRRNICIYVYVYAEWPREISRLNRKDL